MKRNTYTDDQVIAILREAKTGEVTVEALCRKHGCSVAAFYGWKKKYGSAPPEDAKRLRQLVLNFKTKSIHEQKKELSDFFEKWKGNSEQVDDVLVIGITL